MSNFGLLVVGSRTYTDYNEFCSVTNSVLRNMSGVDVTIISGGAKGADSLARRYAQDNHLKFKEFNADWNQFGKQAGYIRNKQMHVYIYDNFKDRGCLAFWDGSSHGTMHNFDLCKWSKTPLIIYDFVKSTYLDSSISYSGQKIMSLTDDVREKLVLPWD